MTHTFIGADKMEEGRTYWTPRGFPVQKVGTNLRTGNTRVKLLMLDGRDLEFPASQLVSEQRIRLNPESAQLVALLEGHAELSRRDDVEEGGESSRRGRRSRGLGQGRGLENLPPSKDAAELVESMVRRYEGRELGTLPFKGFVVLSLKQGACTPEQLAVAAVKAYEGQRKGKKGKSFVRRRVLRTVRKFRKLGVVRANGDVVELNLPATRAGDKAKRGTEGADLPQDRGKRGRGVKVRVVAKAPDLGAPRAQEEEPPVVEAGDARGGGKAEGERKREKVLRKKAGQ